MLRLALLLLILSPSLGLMPLGGELRAPTSARAPPAIMVRRSLAKFQEAVLLAEEEARAQLRNVRTVAVIGPVVAFAAGIFVGTDGFTTVQPAAVIRPAVATAQTRRAAARVQANPQQLLREEPFTVAITPEVLVDSPEPVLSSRLSLFTREPDGALLVSAAQPTADSLMRDVQDPPSARDMKKEAEEAKKETMAADKRRKERLRAAAAERANRALRRQEEAEEYAKQLRRENLPFIAGQLASELRKQKRMEDIIEQRKTAEAERQEAAAQAARLAETKKLEAEAKAARKATAIEDAKREVRLQQAEAIRESALKAQRELERLQLLEEKKMAKASASGEVKRRFITQ